MSLTFCVNLNNILEVIRFLVMIVFCVNLVDILFGVCSYFEFL